MELTTGYLLVELITFQSYKYDIKQVNTTFIITKQFYAGTQCPMVEVELNFKFPKSRIGIGVLELNRYYYKVQTPLSINSTR